MGLWIMENKWQENRFYLEKMGEEKGSFSTNNGNTTINYINGDSPPMIFHKPWKVPKLS